MSVRSSIGYCRTHWTWYWSDHGCAQCATAAKLRDLREQLAALVARLDDQGAELAELQQSVRRNAARITELQQVAHDHAGTEVRP